MVFYRKYRPQTIDELDSKEVRDRLISALSSKDISHAFLFTGPKGLGKTSTARIIAKAVNCERLAPSKLASGSKDKKLYAKRYTLNASVEPCNKCDQCISITNGANIDVLEIDGASNRGIDEIRDLREKIRLAPAYSSKKIYIIDEVHMLTTEAFNALLKTLEEPPSHALFILCTTEPHKVPATIVSRCLHISFRLATSEELVRSFERIVKGEKLSIDKEALVIIASLSEGSFRDGAKILEEVVGIAGSKKITKELVETKYQVSSIKYQVSEMIALLSKKDTKETLQLVSKLTDQGIDIKYFLEQMIGELHSMFLRELGVEEKEKIEDVKWQMEDIKKLIELLGRAHGEQKYAVLPQLPLEMVVIEWGMIDKDKPLVVNAGPAARSSQGAPSSLANAANEGARLGSSSLASPASKSGQARPLASRESNIWYELIDKVKPYNHSVAGVLRGCRLKSFDDKELVVEAGFKFHKERLDDVKTKEVIKKAVKDISGKDVEVRVIMKE